MACTGIRLMYEVFFVVFEARSRKRLLEMLIELDKNLVCRGQFRIHKHLSLKYFTNIFSACATQMMQFLQNHLYHYLKDNKPNTV